MGKGEEGERHRYRCGHVFDGEIGGAGHYLVVHDKLRLGEVDGVVRVGVVAGGILSFAEVHHRVVDFLDFLSVQEAIALLGDDAVDDALLGVEVEGDGVGAVFGVALFEIGFAGAAAAAVVHSGGVYDVGVEIDAHGIGFEFHILVMHHTLFVDESATVVEIESHRIFGFVLDDVLHGVR